MSQSTAPPSAPWSGKGPFVPQDGKNRWDMRVHAGSCPRAQGFGVAPRQLVALACWGRCLAAAWYPGAEEE